LWRLPGEFQLFAIGAIGICIVTAIWSMR